MLMRLRPSVPSTANTTATTPLTFAPIASHRPARRPQQCRFEKARIEIGEIQAVLGNIGEPLGSSQTIFGTITSTRKPDIGQVFCIYNLMLLS
jgi:hypothetical protein